MAGGKRIMKRLYLLRHAKAVPQEEGLADRDRALEKKGRRAAQAVATWIEEQRLEIELALASPALRTRQTLEIVADAFPHAPKVLVEDGLYLATARQLLARLHRLPEATKSVMLIGHNPGFYELAAFLSEVAAGPLMARLGGFPTGALAGFECELPWSALERKRARLVTLALPKELMRALE